MTSTSQNAPALLMHCPSSFGGIPDYAHQQAEALGRAGYRVMMLCQPEFPHRAEAYVQERCLPGQRRPKARLVRIARLIEGRLRGYALLSRRIKETGAGAVLLASYEEYLAPLWAWRFRWLRGRGVSFAAVVHDPVRDFVVGPIWWHRRSISAGYSFLDHAFVHEPIELDTGSHPRAVTTHVIPHGPYPFPDPGLTRVDLRIELSIPPDAPLFLSFGHLRDGKNLALILEAMVSVPSVWLLVAGTEAGSGHVSSDAYRRLAEKLGVGDRCRWRIGFASPEKAADYFNAADYVLLTYEARFRSASGVLNVAVRYQRLVLASCGESNLATAVSRYRLGIRVKPDSAMEIARGMSELLAGRVDADWDGYGSDNSWETNARLVSRSLGLVVPVAIGGNPVQPTSHSLTPP
jgi:glycosyltransferase involved in cell wall biosynthesis